MGDRTIEREADYEQQGSVRLYRVPEVMTMLSLSRSVIYEQIRAGRLRSVTQGRTRLIPAAAVGEYIALLEREADDGAVPPRCQLATPGASSRLGRPSA